MKKYIVGIFAIVSLMAPILVFAQVDNSALIAQLQAQIVQLQAQIQQLLQQQGGGQQWCHDFNKNLGVKNQGYEVQMLHQALKREGFDEQEGPGSTFGHYGEDTASAVVGFQEKYKDEILTPNGLRNGTGYVGPATRKKLNQLYGCGVQTPQVPLMNRSSNPAVPEPPALPLFQRSDLLAAWQFDGTKGHTVYDQSGNGNIGVAFNNPVWITGINGGGISFDGEQSYIDFGSNNILNFAANQSFTYTGWFKTADVTGAILSQRNSSDGGAVINLSIGQNGVDLRPGRLRALIRQNGNAYGPVAAVTSVQRVDDDKWHHFAFMRKAGGALELYLDGLLQGVSQNTEAAGAITTNMRVLGSEGYFVKVGYGTSDDRFFKGSIADVKIYNRAFFSEEVSNLVGSSPQQNLVSNPSFDLASYGAGPWQSSGRGGWVLDKWWFGGGIGSSVNISRERAAASDNIEGSPSWYMKFQWLKASPSCIEVDPWADGHCAFWEHETPYSVKVLADGYAALSVWMKADRSVNIYPAIWHAYDPHNPWQLQDFKVFFCPAQAVTSVWQKFTCVLKLPSVDEKTLNEKNVLGVAFYIDPALEPTLYMSQVQLVNGTQARPFVPRPISVEQDLIQYAQKNYPPPNAEFITPQSSIQVLSPNGGEVWKIGETHRVSWQATEDVLGISLLKGGVAVQKLDFAPGQSYIDWAIPVSTSLGTIIPGTDYKIRVSGKSNYDDSNAPFSITAASLSADIKANGSDGPITVAVGQNITYAWSSANADAYSSSYTIDSPQCSQIGAGPFGWIVQTASGTTSGAPAPCQAGHTYTITYKVTKTATGLSAQDTVIVKVLGSTTQPSITVLSPNGGEVWQVGTTQTVKWISSNLGSICGADKASNSCAMYYGRRVSMNLIDASGTKIALPDSYAYLGSVQITVPTVPPGSYRLEIIAYSEIGYNVFDSSDAPFSIVAAEPVIPTLNVSLDSSTAPGGTLTPGQTNVKFASVRVTAGKDPVNNMNGIQISSDTPGVSNLTNFKVFDGAVQLGNTLTTLTWGGSYYQNWLSVSGFSIPAYGSKVLTFVAGVKPDAQSSTVRLGVFGWNFDSPGALVTPFGTAIYGNTMSISGATNPSITVTSPNGGEKLTVGGTYTIAWKSSGVQNVHIDVTSNTTARTLVSNISASSGVYTWKMDPVYFPVGDNYRVRVFTYPLPPSGGWIIGTNYDQSDASFSIVSSGGVGSVSPTQAELSAGVLQSVQNVLTEIARQIQSLTR